MPAELGYWKIRGLGQHIRLLLEYVGEDYEDKQYTNGPAPDYFDKSDWKPVKFNLGLEFPNLPYYIDGDIKITQSNAIMYHLGRKHNLCGQTETDKIRVDTLVNMVFDLRYAFAILCYRDYNTGKDKYMEALPDKMKVYNDALGDKKWFVGDEITLPDFMIYETLDVHKTLLDANLLKNYPKLAAFMKRFEELRPIKKYMSSSSYIKSPINGAMAIVGGK
ncbi:hypothetical protein Pcinc_043797 [Petrolisthes cinctipes]|uniref:Glutathione S-transferase n=1 Tax=Petrolisthes cinctipes TaxID=88211 RepID=A0AAE1BFY3_PETCI|nr:hypothetical protein Pcinc_043797 [Petrolisthes cinctipes]